MKILNKSYKCSIKLQKKRENRMVKTGNGVKDETNQLNIVLFN